MRLSDFPYVQFRLTCATCKRRGSYRLARLAAKYGAEADVRAVVHDLSRDCPWQGSDWRRKPRKYEPRCGARLADSETPAPPDLPPEARRDGLRVVEGGKEKSPGG